MIAGFPTEKLPTWTQYLIIEQVAKGAGMVCYPSFFTTSRQRFRMRAIFRY